jgi:small-conductance mechanosensitive channel
MGLIERVETVLDTYLGVPPATTERLLQTIAVVLGYLVVRRLARRIVARTVTEPSSRYQVGKAVAYSAGVLALLILAKVWVQGITGMATYLGLLSAGLAIALQDPLANFAGWLFILVRRPFEVGDRIQVGPHTGDVVDIRIFRVIMLEIGNWVHADQSTGRLIHVPNGWVFKNPVCNYEQAFGYIWNELEVLVTYESNWRRAKEVLTRTVTEHSEQLTPDAAEKILAAADSFHIRFSKLTPVVWTSVADSGIRLTMRYLCKARERRSSASEIWESVLDALQGLPDVDLAYPTIRRFDNAREGRLLVAQTVHGPELRGGVGGEDGRQRANDERREGDG